MWPYYWWLSIYFNFIQKLNPLVFANSYPKLLAILSCSPVVFAIFGSLFGFTNLGTSYSPIYKKPPSLHLLHQTQNPTSTPEFPIKLYYHHLQLFLCDLKSHHKMSSASTRAWGVAASVGVVEALKDQGVCRWNHALKSAQQHVKSHARSLSQAKKLSSSSSAMVTSSLKDEKVKKSEESLRTVMYLSCWGPN